MHAGLGADSHGMRPPCRLPCRMRRGRPQNAMGSEDPFQLGQPSCPSRLLCAAGGSRVVSSARLEAAESSPLRGWRPPSRLFRAPYGAGHDRRHSGRAGRSSSARSRPATVTGPRHAVGAAVAVPRQSRGAGRIPWDADASPPPTADDHGQRQIIEGSADTDPRSGVPQRRLACPQECRRVGSASSRCAEEPARRPPGVQKGRLGVLSVCRRAGSASSRCAEGPARPHLAAHKSRLGVLPVCRRAGSASSGRAQEPARRPSAAHKSRLGLI
jgi:hypothetical protein